MPVNEADGILIRQQTELDERLATAGEAAQRLGLTMPVFADGMDDAVSVAFAAWPERIVVIDSSRRIAYPGAPGPDGFEPAEAAPFLTTG